MPLTHSVEGAFKRQGACGMLQQFYTAEVADLVSKWAAAEI